MRAPTQLYNQLKRLATEQVNPATDRIDRLTVPGILRTINREDATVHRAVRRELPAIARVVDLAVKALHSGGRLIYAGAGTSGRLGVLDASECPPTFGTDPRLVLGIIAGGRKAVFRSQEGSEDRRGDGRKHMRAQKVRRGDIVCGIAASARTPYVLGALAEAKRRGASTVLITTNPRVILRRREFRDLRDLVDEAVCLDVGPEVIMGSTRMKSGTAQKMVLNMITTAAMIRLGKVYGNMMVDLQMNSRKLAERAKRVIMLATGASYGGASRALRDAGGNAKTAIVMLLVGCTPARARALLKQTDGFIHRALRAVQ